jgi:glycine/sarcosine N-methyltransferase
VVPMDSSVVSFYDGLSEDYHLLFEDWPQAVRWQGGVLDRLLRGLLGDRPLAVLDCCCGIGTQAIGLALLGHRVHATDLTPAAVERAAREAVAFGVVVTFGVADVRTLPEQVEGVFDAVIACDNSLPHLLTEADLRRGVGGMAAKLRPGGVFLATTRDYDVLVRERSASTPVRVFGVPPCRVTFQIWDWSADGRSYRVHQFILKEEGGWRMAHHAGAYRALLREELTGAIREAGLAEVRWYTPEESGYYQPVVTARKP